MEPTVPFYCLSYGGTIVKIYDYNEQQARPFIGAWYAELDDGEGRWIPGTWHKDGTWVGDGTTARSIDLNFSTAKAATSVQEFTGS